MDDSSQFNFNLPEEINILEPPPTPRRPSIYATNDNAMATFQEDENFYYIDDYDLRNPSSIDSIAGTSDTRKILEGNMIVDNILEKAIRESESFSSGIPASSETQVNTAATPIAVSERVLTNPAVLIDTSVIPPNTTSTLVAMYEDISSEEAKSEKYEPVLEDISSASSSNNSDLIGGISIPKVKMEYDDELILNTLDANENGLFREGTLKKLRIVPRTENVSPINEEFLIAAEGDNASNQYDMVNSLSGSLEKEVSEPGPSNQSLGLPDKPIINSVEVLPVNLRSDFSKIELHDEGAVDSDFLKARVQQNVSGTVPTTGLVLTENKLKEGETSMSVEAYAGDDGAQLPRPPSPPKPSKSVKRKLDFSENNDADKNNDDEEEENSSNKIVRYGTVSETNVKFTDTETQFNKPLIKRKLNSNDDDDGEEKKEEQVYNDVSKKNTGGTIAKRKKMPAKSSVPQPNTESFDTNNMFTSSPSMSSSTYVPVPNTAHYVKTTHRLPSDERKLFHPKYVDYIYAKNFPVSFMYSKEKLFRNLSRLNLEVERYNQEFTDITQSGNPLIYLSDIDEKLKHTSQLDSRVETGLADEQEIRQYLKQLSFEDFIINLGKLKLNYDSYDSANKNLDMLTNKLRNQLKDNRKKNKPTFIKDGHIITGTLNDNLEQLYNIYTLLTAAINILETPSDTKKFKPVELETISEFLKIFESAQKQPATA